MTPAGDGSWAALRHEAARETIGPLWLSEIEHAVRMTAIRFPPAIYAETGTWNHDSLLNLAQEVIAQQLLAAGQLQYILDVARTVDHARALLVKVTKRALASSRSRTVIDNLLQRCRSLATAEDPQSLPTSPSTRAATDEELRSAAIEVAKLPRVAIRSSDRAPQVFTTATLRQVLAIVDGRLPSAYALRELAIVFELALTDHLPGALVFFDGSFDEPDRALSPEEEVMMRQEVDRVYHDLDPDERLVLGLKIAERSDESIAEALHLSRPTVAKIRLKAAGRMRQGLIDLPESIRNTYIESLAGKLLERVAAFERGDRNE